MASFREANLVSQCPPCGHATGKFSQAVPENDAIIPVEYRRGLRLACQRAALSAEWKVDPKPDQQPDEKAHPSLQR
jgi:hypothetical protein